MNFTSQLRHNPETGEYEKYYRLKESYRDASGRPCTRLLLTVGFIHGLSPVEIRDVARGLTYKYDNQDKLDTETLEHKEARDTGAEWLCLQALRQVGFDKFLLSLGWAEEDVKSAIAHLIVRTVYTPSELRSIRIMQRNSAVCWLVDLALKDVKHRKVSAWPTGS